MILLIFFNFVDCVEEDGHYTGQKKSTGHGKPCLSWNMYPRDSRFVIPEKNAKHNFCRLVKYRESRVQPWCYTGNDYKWEYCDIPSCGKFLLPSNC